MWKSKIFFFNGDIAAWFVKSILVREELQVGIEVMSWCCHGGAKANPWKSFINNACLCNKE